MCRAIRNWKPWGVAVVRLADPELDVVAQQLERHRARQVQARVDMSMISSLQMSNIAFSRRRAGNQTDWTDRRGQIADVSHHGV